MSLATALVALVCASHAFAAATSRNDPFRALAVHTAHLPVCCLKPALPSDTSDVLLSFEDWKAKRSPQAKPKSVENTALQNTSQTSPSHDLPDFPSIPHDAWETDTVQPVSPHFRVPITDRFNYASLDCSARVHTSHRSAKSPSSILSSKRDRYMLSPCASSHNEMHYVVVELCDDIRIDTVQLANFEFFSGVFKDFTVSVTKTYTTDAGGWTVAGVYTAKNIRGVQSFHPPTSLRDFYRYIRIDFHSHYGNEYYCPVSLLRVYGLTHLEQWKWDIWEAESRAKRNDMGDTPPPHEEEHLLPQIYTTKLSVATPAGSTPDDPALTPNTIEVGLLNSLKASRAMPTDEHASSPMVPNAENSGKPALGATSATPSSMVDVMPGDAPRHSPDLRDDNGHSRPALHPILPAGADVPGGRPAHISMSIVSITQGTHSASIPLDPSRIHPSKLPRSENIMTDPTHSPGYTSVSSTTTSTASTTSPHTAVPPPLPTGGESIYRTIMNRLTALEANHTLYARYVEEQTAGVREALRRLAEDVGRLEGIAKAQAQLYQRSLSQWERQGDRLGRDYREVMSRVNYLADEVVLEKRLGIAQLCLLLAVLVFMGATRGSRGEAPIPPPSSVKLNDSLKSWSRRHLSFSGDWVSRLKPSATPPPPPKRRPPPLRNLDVDSDDGDEGDGGSDGRRALAHALSRDHKLAFPSQSAPLLKPLRPSRRQNTSAPSDWGFSAAAVGGAHREAGSRSRTPVSRRFEPTHALAPSASSSSWLLAPLAAPPPLHAGIGQAPKSARRWARSAHLHDVRRVKGPTGGGGGGGGRGRREEVAGRERERGRKRAGWEWEHDVSAIFDAGGPVAFGAEGEGALGGGARGGAGFGGQGEGVGEGDGWVDTDVSIDEEMRV